MTRQWTIDQTQKAVNYWKLGKTAQEIADLIGKSRSAVLGKLDRVQKGKMRERSKTSNERKRVIPKVTDYNPSKKREEIMCTSYSEKKKLGDLSARECHFPLGGVKDEPEWFCGAQVAKKGYCEQHYAICYMKGKKND